MGSALPIDLDLPEDTLARFAGELDALSPAGRKLGVAVSGGPDSVALLLLAAGARPGRVEAATVDHGLREGSAAEAQMVARLCDRLGVAHAVLALDWPEPPEANVQARARDARYAALGQWALERGIDDVASAHHLDDQAETLLLRVARGAGVGGLAAMAPSRPLTSGDDRVRLIRPLLGWRRDELRAVPAAAGIVPVEDPANSDARFDRTRARSLLAATAWLDPLRLAAVAGHAADAGQALDWTAGQEFDRRQQDDGDGLSLDPSGLPRELKRRLLLLALRQLGGTDPPGPQLIDALDRLERGETTTLAGLKLAGGARWRLSPAPPRRR